AELGSSLIPPPVPVTSDDSDTTVIILETYGADPEILRSCEPLAEESPSEAQHHDLITQVKSPSSLLLRGSQVSQESDDGNWTDHSSQTDTSTDTLVFDLAHYEVEDSVVKEPFAEYDQDTGALIEYPNDNGNNDTLKRSRAEESLAVLETEDHFFVNFEEEFEQAERQYPELQAEDLLSDQDIEESKAGNYSEEYLTDNEEEELNVIIPSATGDKESREIIRYPTILESDEEVPKIDIEKVKLDFKMGQYYSSASGGDPSRGEGSGSLPSSPRSSEGWRMSMASTATVASTTTANSDDTVAKDMSELSSVNSRLSCLDEALDEVKGLPSKSDPNATPKATPQSERKRQTSIKDAIDELESIEQAAQNLLQKKQYTSEEGKEKYTTDDTLKIYIAVKESYGKKQMEEESVTEQNVSKGSTQKVTETPLQSITIEENENEHSTQQASISQSHTSPLTNNALQKHPIPLNTTLASEESTVSHVVNGFEKPKGDNERRIISEEKPPLPPTASSQPPKVDIKRRWWSKNREIQPYISRESYNDERVFKELERLRRSYQESDLNDFLDTLESTPIPDDIDEAFLRQLLLDISVDVEGVTDIGEEEVTLNPEEVCKITESRTPDSEEIIEIPRRPSSSTGKFEKVKERILEMIKVRKKRKGKESVAERSITPKADTKSANESMKDELNRPETPQISRSVTPQSMRPETPDSKSSRPQTPDGLKGDDSKKGFNIAEFFKKGSPKYLRKKYKERKNRKSDLITTSESESEDTENSKKDNGNLNNSSRKTESQSSLKGSNRSLNSSQELRKEVRFDLNTDSQRKVAESSSSKGSKTDPGKPAIIKEALKEPHRLSAPQWITCEAQQQETVIIKGFEETTQELDSDVVLTLPTTVEDINNKNDNLLPRLPERVKPPRRKKKLLPVPVEELSADLSDNTASTTSSDSVKLSEPKASDPRTETLKNMASVKDESPPPLPPYEDDLDTTKESCKNEDIVDHSSVAVDLVSDISEIRETYIEEEKKTVAESDFETRNASDVMQDTATSSGEIKLSSAIVPQPPEAYADNEPKTIIDNESASFVAPLLVTSVAPISVAPDQIPETSVAMMYPPRTLPLPVIQESVQEDQISISTPSETLVSCSVVASSSDTPAIEEENAQSLYDNVNPFKELIEEEMLSASSEVQTTSDEVAIETETITRGSRDIKKTTSAIPVSEEPIAQTKPQICSPQEACKSPAFENKVTNIDELAALTAEMFKFAESAEEATKGSKEYKPILPSSLMKTTTRNIEQESQSQAEKKEIVTQTEEEIISQSVDNDDLVDYAKSNTIAVQTDLPRQVRTYEAASQTDTEYETDLETESEMEENVLNQYDSSKWLFGSSPLIARPIPPPRDLHQQELLKRQEVVIKELQKQTVMQQQRRVEAPEAPPRQFQQKMPLTVVHELKTVLADAETSTPKLKKITEPRRWDTDLTWDDGRLASNPTNIPLKPSESLASVSSTKPDASQLLPLPTGSPIDSISPPDLSPNPIMQSQSLSIDKTFIKSEKNGRLDRRPSCSVSTDDLATIPEETAISTSRVVEENSRQLNTRTREAIENKQLMQTEDSSKVSSKGNNPISVVVAGDNITTAKIRANVYPSFAHVSTIPRGKPPVPKPSVRRLTGDGTDDGYQSDPGARRSNGKHKFNNAKAKPSVPVTEDRGYATDSEIIVHHNPVSKKTHQDKLESSSQPFLADPELPELTEMIRAAVGNKKTLQSSWAPFGQLSDIAAELLESPVLTETLLK
ncbi:hypothetical protein SK128_012057, partial [Halocaridina rubra]